MYAVTLLTSAESGSLDRELVESLRSAWGGYNSVWLAPKEAAEFEIGEVPTNQWEVWQDLQERQVDLVVQVSAGRKKRMLLADMDSTMIDQECIDELADLAGIGSRVAEITARAMDGEINFEDALRERVGLLRGLDSTIVDKVLTERITHARGARTLVATMKANGCHAALVSGGFTDFTKTVAADLGFDEHRANTLLVNGGKLTGTVADPILGQHAKVAALDEISSRLGLRSDDVIAVGDGANDLGMLHLAGTGVALHAKPSVARQCDVRINHGDLTALLFLQGYTSSSFIRK